MISGPIFFFGDNLKSKPRYPFNNRVIVMAAMVQKDVQKEAAVTTPYYSLITEGKNPRGIPQAKFIENVEEFLKDASIEAALGALNELYSKVSHRNNSF